MSMVWCKQGFSETKVVFSWKTCTCLKVMEQKKLIFELLIKAGDYWDWTNFWTAAYFSFLPRCMECRGGLAMWFLSVCLSVRLSDKRVHCDKTEEKSVQIFIPCERSFSLVFSEEEWWVGGDPFYLKFWVKRPPLERNRRFWTNNPS